MKIYRNIPIGLIDGLTISFALAAGLNSIVSIPATIVKAGVIAGIAGAFTMSVSSYLSAKAHEKSIAPVPAAITIGLAYLSGAFIAVMPYLLTEQYAFICSAAISITILFIAGYFDSAFNGANGFIGAIRVAITGVVAATAAFLVAKLFI